MGGEIYLIVECIPNAMPNQCANAQFWYLNRKIKFQIMLFLVLNLANVMLGGKFDTKYSIC